VSRPTHTEGSAHTRGNPVSAQLLIDLVTDTLDPGYAAAARRRGDSAPQRRWYDRPAVAVGCVLIGFVLVVAYVHTHRGAPEAAKVHDRLVQRVRSEERDNDSLGKQVSGLEAGLSREQASALPASGPLAQNLALEQQDAGDVAVTGPGFTVMLIEPPTPSSTDAAGRAGSDSLASTNILTDRDVRSVVNELWNDGAEAIAVNGIRLTATSAIRFAGQAVLVDFQPITSPYTVEAIGNSDDLSTTFAQSAVASRYQTLVSADGIGFSFHNDGTLSLAAGAPVTPRYAVAAPSATRSGR
jgi:uncharacterized protein YlxW (UPF0749 family)